MNDRKYQQAKEKLLETLFTPRINKVLPEADDNKSLMEHIPDLLNKQKCGLYLCGPSGTGKTIQAAQILIEVHMRSLKQNLPFYDFRFVSVPQLLQNIKATFNGDNNDESVIVKDLSEADFLILDDLGVEKSTEWVMQILYLILNYRYEYLKTTIITSNYSINDLIDKFGSDRIPSRIAGMCEVIRFDKKDFRIRK